MNFNLLAAGLDENLAEIVAKLQSLMDSFWLYIVLALAGVVVIWGAYIGIKIAIAPPLLINGLSAWVNAT